jgi:hypothetical protein
LYRTSALLYAARDASPNPASLQQPYEQHPSGNSVEHALTHTAVNTYIHFLFLQLQWSGIYRLRLPPILGLRRSGFFKTRPDRDLTGVVDVDETTDSAIVVVAGKEAR